jgi:hypothetical protein
VTQPTPVGLSALVEWAHPDALWIEYERVTEEVWDVGILDLDYRYTRWRAVLSPFTLQWTLNPLSM